MYYDGNEMVQHYREWLTANQQAIADKLAPCMEKEDPRQMVQETIQVFLHNIMPMAIAEMLMFNNHRLEPIIDEKMDNAGCNSCSSHIIG